MQRLAERCGLGTAEGDLEAALSLCPESVGLGELCAAVRREPYQPSAPIVRVDRDSNKTVALQWL